MKRRLFAVIACLASVVPSAAAATEGQVSGREAELASFLAEAAAAFDVPGAIVVVATRDGAPAILVHGVRCSDAGGPVTPRTSFSLASLTKAFTATAAAALVGDGTLDWDTRARSLIPELELADPVASERVTLRDLLAHRSGLVDDTIASANVAAGPAWLLPRLASFEPAGEFRDRYTYSTLGYAVAGEMIGRAAGSSWSAVVSERLLGPLGMTSTTVGPAQRPEGEPACGHLRQEGRVSVLVPYETAPLAPGNGLYSTASDLARWLELLLGEGMSGGERIVDERALRETWTPQVVFRRAAPELRAYGLGWQLSTWRGRRLVSHDGGGPGFTSSVRLLPDAGVAIAAVANVAVNPLPDVVSERAAELLLDEPPRQDLIAGAGAMVARLDDIRAAQARSVRASGDPSAPPTADLPAYAGCYDNHPYGTLEVSVAGDRLAARFHGLEVAVEHLHDDVFLLSNPYTGDLPAAFAVMDGAAASVSMPLGFVQPERRFDRRPGPCPAHPTDTSD